MFYQNTADFLVTLMTLYCRLASSTPFLLIFSSGSILNFFQSSQQHRTVSQHHPRGDHFLDLGGRRSTPDWAVMISRTCTHTYIEYTRVSPAPLRRFGRAPGATSRKPEPQRDMRNRHNSYITCRWSTRRHARCVMSSCLVRQ